MICITISSNLKLIFFFRKNQNGLGRKWSTVSQILKIHQTIKVRAKNLKATLLLVDFFQVFCSIHDGKIEEIVVANGLPQKNCYSHNDALQKHESQGKLPRWR